jgi:hypothetical protein
MDGDGEEKVTVDSSGLAEGAYVVEVTTQEGIKASKKLIIDR